MKKNILLTAVALFITLTFSVAAFACLTIAATKGATKDGSVIVTHNDDNELDDQRIIYVPARDNKPGAKRAIFKEREDLGHPRIVTETRGPGYDTEGKPSEILGYIDEVGHTYAYFDATNGIMNEHQLLVGEAQNGSKYQPEGQPGKRLLCMDEISRIILERCTKAREAVKLAGELVEKYRYYGRGETLTIADPEECWVFEACATPDDAGDLWVAKKVPDGEIFVGANEYKIRDVLENDPDMMHCPKLFDITKRLGWWDPNAGPLDWLKAVSYGEYNHPYYSLRRVWRIMTKLNPDIKVSPWVEDSFTREYPFSFKPKEKVDVRDIVSVMRDHYEGTEFDLTQGIAAGPYGCPVRYIGAYDPGSDDVTKDKNIHGSWERPISVYYCGYSYVCQARSYLPDPVGGVAWIGMDEPFNTVYVPFYAGVTDLPESYQKVSTKKFDRNSTWWAFNFVSNWSALKYNYMIEDIQEKQAELEDDEFEEQPDIEKKALELHKKEPAKCREYLTEYCDGNADEITKKWWELADTLVAQYADGYVNKPETGEEVGYPKWWLKLAGYYNGPISYEKKESKLPDNIDLWERLIKVPLTRQSTDHTCSVAAMQSVLAYFGFEIREDDLANKLKTTNEGSRKEDMTEFARSKGFDVDMYTDMSLDELRRLLDKDKPVLVVIQAWSENKVSYKNDWDDGHWVVAIGYDKDNFYFMDPSTLGNYTYIPKDEFDQRWHDTDMDGKTELSHFGIVMFKEGPTYEPDKIKRLE